MSKKNIENDMSQEAKEVLIIQQSDKSIDEKLKCFKEFQQSIIKDDLNNSIIFADDHKNLKDLLLMHYLLESKHPVKKLIQVFIESNSFYADPVDIISKFLQNQAQKFQNENLSSENCYGFISYLNELSQNFEIGSYAVGLSCMSLAPFLNSAIEALLNELLTDVAPSRKSETSHILHNTFQAYIFCVKCCVSFYHRKDKNQFYEFIEALTQICFNIFELKDIKMETKNIYAMIVIIKNYFKNNGDHIKIIEDSNEIPEKRFCFMSALFQISETVVDLRLDRVHSRDITISKIQKYCKTLDSFSKTVDNSITYTISKLLMQLIKKLFSCKIYRYVEINSIIQSSMHIIFMNLEHSAETIRYLSKDTIKILIELGKKIPDGEQIINQIFRKVSSLSIDLQASVISSISSTISVKNVLQKLPNLLDMILSSIASNKEVKISCFLALSNQACSEQDFNDWLKTFIIPIEQKVKELKKEQEENLLLSSLLLKCIKKDKKAIQELLKRKTDFDTRFNFMLLNLAKEEGLLENDLADKSMWKGIISYDELKKSIVDIDIDIRLLALQLIVETKKLTNGFTNEEIDCIMFFFENNTSLITASTKQNLIGLIKKMFTRIRCIIQSYLRKNNKELLEQQFDVLMKFHEFSLRNLNNASNYSRRSFSLVLLAHNTGLITECFKHKVEELWTEQNFNLLYSTLHDTYEDNKEKSLEIMLLLPKDLIHKYSKIDFDLLEKIHKSIKPADSLTASYLMLFHLKFGTTSECESYNLIVWCENLLTKAISTAENSVIVAAGSNPMYAFISSIRMIISNLNLDEILVHQKWKDFFTRLLDITKRLTKVASPIVNDPSPEGIYPKENLHMLINEDNEDDILKIIQNTTSQMILLCAWRVIKEVSLLLGFISLKGAKICGSENELCSVNQLIDIGDHFLELLTNIKHRGAFEQCFSGFSQYCVALRTSNCPELHTLPSQILENILISISQKDDELDGKSLISMKNLCATRRSAGLPFIVQALLISEIKISKHENFHYTMKTLLNVVKSGEELDMRVHSLNILRALFRCKELNDVIGEYICEGIKYSISGCGADTWAERNSSTLLFSALMIRTFGVQRNKDCDQIDIKNKMNSKIFFVRFPDLYEFFLEQLNQSVEYVERQQMNPRLFPLLLILNRLYISPSDNSETNLSLLNFVPLVTACSGCNDMRVRILCAKFVSNLIPKHKIFERIYTNMRGWEGNDLSANFKHGRLLEVLYLVKIMSSFFENCKIDHFYLLRKFISLINCAASYFKKYSCEIVLFSTLMDIVIELMKIVWNYAGRGLVDRENLKSGFEFEKSALFGAAAIRPQLIIWELILMEIDDTVSMIRSFRYDLEYYELLHKLNCFMLILSDDDKRKEIVEEYEIDQRMSYFISINYKEKLDDLRKEMRNNQTFIKELVKLTFRKDTMIQARYYEIQSLIYYVSNDSLSDINSFLTKSFIDQPDGYKAAVFKSIKKWLEKNEESIGHLNWKIIADVIESSNLARSAGIDLLKFSGRYLLNMSLKVSFFFTGSLMNLLMDDNSDICERTSAVVSDIVGSDRIYIGSYAADLLLKFLVEKSMLKQDEKYVLLILLLLIEERGSCDFKQNEDNEFQVFDKSDSNSTREHFVTANTIKTILRSEFGDSKIDITSKVLSFCKEIKFDVTAQELSDVVKKVNQSN